MGSLDDVRREFVQLWGRLGPFWGVSPAAARVYAFLISRAEAVDAESIVDGLEMSRGAVSMACRELADWGLVLSERAPGERKLSYSIEEDPTRIIRGIVATRKRREWDPLLNDVARWRRELSGERAKDAAALRERLREIEGLVALVDSIAQSFLGGGAIPKLGIQGLVAMARAKRKRS